MITRRRNNEEAMAEPQLQRMTPEDFLAWQEKQDKLYELVDGLPVLPLKMMTGATQTHDRVVVNIIISLGNQLRGGPCRPTTDDLAVRIPAGNIRRPDITVECGQGGPREMTVREPRVIIEVLSPRTRTFDRFRKLVEYQSIEGLQHILLVDTEAPQIDIVSRQPDGTWSPMPHEGLDALVELPAVSASLKLSDVYEGVTFPIE